MSDVQRIDVVPPIQAGLMFHLINDEHPDGTYVEQFVVQIEGLFQYDKFIEALHGITKRCEVMRTTFLHEDLDQVVRIIRKEGFTRVNHMDASKLEGDDVEDLLCKLLVEDRTKPFVVSEEAPIRFSILSTSDNSFKLICSYHHILIDGYSFKILLRDLLVNYDNVLHARGTDIQLLGMPDAHFIQWLNEQDWMGASDYWNSYLANYDSNYSIPKRNYQDVISEYKELKLVVDPELFKNLKSVAAAYRVTINVVFQGIWAMMLQRYANSEDVVYGLVTSLRDPGIENIEHALGVFLNTIPMRVISTSNTTLVDLLRNIQNDMFKSREFSYYPLHQIQGESEISQDLIDHILIFNNHGDIPAEDQFSYDLNDQITGMNVSNVTFASKSHYPLEMIFDIYTNHAELSIIYDRNRYDWELLNLFKGHFLRIVQLVADQKTELIRDFDMLTAQEKGKLLSRQELTSMPEFSSVFHMFEQQANAHPNETAVVSIQRTMTYRELLRESTNLSNEMISMGLLKGTAVGLLFDRNEWFIIGALAILRSNLRYVPLDPEAPEDRNLYIMQDSGIQLLLSEKKLWEAQDRNYEGMNCLFIDKASLSDSDQKPSALTYPVLSDDGAYIIYTSGTTGRPKGVEMQHKSIINLVRGLSLEIYAPFEKKLNVAQLAPFFFDQSIEEIFGSLLLGHTLFVATNEERLNQEQLLHFLDNHAIQMMNGSPSYIRSVLFENKQPRFLRRLLIGGEKVPHQLLEDLFQLYGQEDLEVFNVYGPTECCVDATYYKVNLNEIKSWQTTPIGKPMMNKTAYILDKYDRLQPVGISGELVIGGEGLSTGYIRLPDMSRSRFVPNPFLHNEQMYRTGDQAKWLSSGYIDFLGRNDRMVKLHGYRIELEEIEKCLLSHNAIEEVAVLLKDTEDRKFLCAFVVVTEGKKILDHDLKLWASRTLPPYMVPTKIVFLEEFPLSDRGKVEHHLLERMNVTGGSSEQVTRDPEVMKIIHLWEGIFKFEGIGPQDHFFELGGHSLYAANFISKLKKEMGINATLKELFLYPTPADFAKLIKHKLVQGSSVEELEPMFEATSTQYSLTPAQTRMFLMHQMNMNSTKYNISGKFRINKPLDTSRLRTCFHRLLKEHEILRTRFSVEDGTIMASILQEWNFNVHVWQSEPADDEWITSFDLNDAPLLRVSVFEVTEECFDLFIDMHHIITDGISNLNLINQFILLYDGEPVEANYSSYKYYALWFESYMKSQKSRDDQAYWYGKLEAERTDFTLLPDYSRTSEQDGKAETVWIELNAAMTASLRELAKGQDATLFSVLLAAYNVMIYKYNGQEDVLLGTAVSGRTQPGFEESVGLFVNTIALRNYPSGGKTFTDFLNEVTDSLMNDLEHQDYPFDQLVDDLSIKRERSRNPIFDVMFIMQNRTHADNQMNEHDDIVEHVVPSGDAKFDLLIEVFEHTDDMLIKLEFNSSLYTKNTIEKHGEYLVHLIADILSKPHEKIANLNFMRQVEVDDIIREFDRTQMEFPVGKTIQHLFEQQVATVPDHIAVNDQVEALTYRQLNERSNQVANALLNKGVSAGHFVALHMDRSIHAIVSILAILKVGAAYVPINTKYSDDLIRYIMEDCGAEFVIADLPSDVWDAFDASGKKISLSDLVEIYENGDTTNPAIAPTPEHLAYLIYTSGTTGKPKGVMITHANIVRLFENEAPFFPFHEQEVWALFHALSFDYSVWEMYGALLKGARLVIVPNEAVYDNREFLQLLIREKVTVLNQTPGALYALIRVILGQGVDLPLKYVLSSGEAIHPIRLLAFHEAYPEIKILNIYGITETTVFTTYKELRHEEMATDNRSVGRPIPTLSTYLLNKDGQLSPQGGIGELYVGGAGVARGYLNREELNQERFLDNPFAANQKMYKSGDLMRMSSERELEYVGRIDDQVKIRGYRIELSDVEENLLKYSEIEGASVLPLGEHPNNYLCAFYVSQRQLPIEELKSHLNQKLPSYSVPYKYVHLNTFPLTLNGKINRRKLIELAECMEANPITLPRNEMEMKISVYWSDLLEKQGFGIEDDFFELGGNSLQAMQLADFLQKEYQIYFTIKDVFDNPTIASLSNEVAKSSRRNREKLIATNVITGARYPLSLAQNRIFLLSQHPNIGMSYNIVSKFDLFGAFDFSRLESALKTIIERHSVLRYRFGYHKGMPVQFMGDYDNFLYWFDSTIETRDQLMAQFLQPFDVVGEVPLFSAAVIRIENQHHVLVINIQHLISDGISMGILERELVALLRGETLPSIEYQYHDYVNWETDRYKRQMLDIDKNYWLTTFSDFKPTIALNTNTHVQSFRGGAVSYSLPQSLLEDLTDLSNDKKTTLFNVLLTLYKCTLHLLWGSEDIVVGTPVSGRVEQEFSDTMGMFVNTLPVRSKPHGSMNYNDYLNQIKMIMQEALKHQLYPLDKLVEELGIATAPGRSPLFRFMFSYEVCRPSVFYIDELKIVANETMDDGSAMMDLTFGILESPTGTEIQVEYDTSQFSKDMVEYIVETFVEIASQVRDDHDIKLNQIKIKQQNESEGEWNTQQFEFDF
ncbi:amino acid adenylation domain-containing protein [Paenibacillus marchantiae]|uniref:non-ribosomal peptide synthetase n=1 Tax=Paenibacillus marchantiae TaxID=3026433 RepID=UPI00237C1E9A|nr:non-ribosomal peptide synthetase [Paenibacillus marchantiae]WDQ32372.1 amino acid adenylation domain-containing protein [Paenibacillus marchantiae]